MKSFLKIKDTHYIYKTQAMLESCIFMHEMERIIYPMDEYPFTVYEWKNDKFMGSKNCKDYNEVSRFEQAENERCKDLFFIIHDRRINQLWGMRV